MAKSRERGTGSVYLPKDPKNPGQKLKTWWISYYIDGKRKRESSRSRKKSDAQALLKRRMGEHVLGLRLETRRSGSPSRISRPAPPKLREQRTPVPPSGDHRVEPAPRPLRRPEGARHRPRAGDLRLRPPEGGRPSHRPV